MADGRARLLKAGVEGADERRVTGIRHPRGVCVLILGLMLAGCENERDAWPPPPRTREEKDMITAAQRAVEQQDGWNSVAWVVERHEGGWRVQAWKIVNPNAKGRNRCVPWEMRVVLLDHGGTVREYRNHL